MRGFLRAVGWVVSELVPAQALRTAMNRDFHRVSAERDVWRHRAEVMADALADREAEEDVAEGQCMWCGDRSSDSHECQRFASVAPENPADATPTPVEQAPPSAPGVGDSAFAAPPTDHQRRYPAGMIPSQRRLAKLLHALMHDNDFDFDETAAGLLTSFKILTK